MVGWRFGNTSDGSGRLRHQQILYHAQTTRPGLNTTGMRSIPDVVTNADPNTGVEICQASAGGCPDNLFYGGTSIAGANLGGFFVAVINQAVGSNLGMANTALYPLANTSAYHDASSMGSDFEHVGLGSPNIDQMILALSHQTAGPADAVVRLYARLSRQTSPVHRSLAGRAGPMAPRTAVVISAAG